MTGQLWNISCYFTKLTCWNISVWNWSDQPGWVLQHGQQEAQGPGGGAEGGRGARRGGTNYSYPGNCGLNSEDKY